MQSVSSKNMQNYYIEQKRCILTLFWSQLKTYSKGIENFLFCCLEFLVKMQERACNLLLWTINISNASPTKLVHQAIKMYEIYFFDARKASQLKKRVIYITLRKENFNVGIWWRRAITGCAQKMKLKVFCFT